MKVFLSTLVVLSFLAVTACSVNPQIYNDKNKGRILNKANFFFQCEKENLNLTCINSHVRVDDFCSEYGVVGCNTKAIYTEIGGTWIMTSSKTL